MKRWLFRSITIFCMLCVVATLISWPAAASEPSLALLVIDPVNNRVLRYDGVTGAFIDVFIPSGSGGLDGPQYITIGPDGNLYVSNWANGSVKRYDSNTGDYLGDFIPPGSGGLSRPDQIVFHTDGNVYVSDRFAARVLRYNGQTGAFIDTFVQDDRLGGFVAFTFGPDGNLYASMFNGIQCVLRFDGQTGAFIDEFVCASDGASAFGGLTFGPDGNLYATRFHRGEVWQLDSSGQLLNVLHCPGDTNADYVAFGPDGRLYLDNQEQDVISYFDVQSGQCLGSFLSGGPAYRPKAFVWISGEPTTQEVTIDIRPKSAQNIIKPNAENIIIPVAILSDPDFDATNVDPATVRFGPQGAAHPADRKPSKGDVDNDGDRDLVLRFKLEDTGIQCGDTSASLTGTTLAGQAFSGSDFIKTVGCQ